MKKVIFLISVFLFTFWILVFSVIKTVAGEDPPIATESIQKQEIDYLLPYPGILPDHFLYPVKMVRDRIQLWLTTNPLKKAELMLLFADKRLGAGKALIEDNKIDLGISTLTKGEKYLQRAVFQETLAREKEETRVLLEKLSLAALKHEEILLILKEKVGDSAKPALEESLNLVKQIQAQIKQALSE